VELYLYLLPCVSSWCGQRQPDVLPLPHSQTTALLYPFQNHSAIYQYARHAILSCKLRTHFSIYSSVPQDLSISSIVITPVLGGKSPFCNFLQPPSSPLIPPADSSQNFVSKCSIPVVKTKIHTHTKSRN